MDKTGNKNQRDAVKRARNAKKNGYWQVVSSLGEKEVELTVASPQYRHAPVDYASMTMTKESAIQLAAVLLKYATSRD